MLNFRMRLVLSEFSNWEDNFRVKFSDAIGNTDSSGSNQSTTKYYPITTKLRKFMRTACELLLSMTYGTQDFQHSIRKAATKI